MTDLGPVAWPPAPIKTERLVLRESEARDRAAFIELFASSDVHTYLGGPRPRGARDTRTAAWLLRDRSRRSDDRPDHAHQRHGAPSAGCREGRARLPLSAGGLGTRIRRRGVRSGTGLVC